MEYFRRYLIELRKLDNTKPLFLRKLAGATVIGICLGFLVDLSLPEVYWVNLIRAIIAFCSGISCGSLVYLTNIRINYTKKERDKSYKPLKKRLSFNQRRNISLLVGGVVVLFILLNGGGGSAVTFKTTVSITMFFSLVEFAKRDRSEFIKSIYNIPDVRDLEFKSRKRLEKREEEETTKTEKTSEKKTNNPTPRRTKKRKNAK